MFEWEYNLPLLCLVNISKDKKMVEVIYLFILCLCIAATYLRLYRQERRNGAISRLRNYKNLDLASSTGVVHFSVKELTRDHHPDRDDEKLRVETAGGYVLEWGGVPRVNGELAISRAIGDVSFKR